jgi:hypothetical protein
MLVERLTKNVGRSPGGRQLFQQHPNAAHQRLAALDCQPRIVPRVDWSLYWQIERPAFAKATAGSLRLNS